MTDFRALCAELVEALSLNDYYDEKTGNMAYQTLLSRARTALAEPQPSADGEVAATGKSGLQDGPAVQSREPASVIAEPSDEELLELMPQQMRDDLAAAARALAGFDPDNIKAASVFRIILNRHVADHGRAVLARWGAPNLAETRSLLEPIPVSERLPEAEDCDVEGRCWWWYAPVPEQTYGYWAHEDHAIPERALEEWPTHWLPAYALPLPKGVE